MTGFTATDQARFTWIETGLTTAPFGFATCEVYDHDTLVAVCHEDNAQRLVEALRYAAGEQ